MRGGWGSASSLTVEDAAAITREVTGIAALSPEMSDRSQVLANGLNWNTTIRGEDISYLDIRLWNIDEGEMFSEADVHSATKVCVIGRTTATQLFQDSDPVGQSLRIRNIPFKVLGVLASKGFNYLRTGSGRCRHHPLHQPHQAHRPPPQSQFHHHPGRSRLK
ncbi:MAG: ABC transporter permease [Bifidobacterium adolescentis]